MFKKFIELVNENKKIILLRHVSPDFDAIGSQMSLYQFIADNFENKDVFCGGELPQEYKCIGITKNLTENDFENALVVITDTATTSRIDIPNLDWLKKVNAIFKIDHHINVDKYGTYEIVEPSYPATCELLTDLYNNSDLNFSAKTAFYLFHGLVTDTDRFMYRNVTSRTFKMATILIDKGININEVYTNIYGLTEDEIKLKGYILSNYKMSPKKVAYVVLTQQILHKYNVTNFDKVSLWVNMLGKIKGAKAWVFFTETDEFVRVEFRSDKISVVDVAVKFGGGGHVSASGAKLSKIELHKDVIDYLDNSIN